MLHPVRLLAIACVSTACTVSEVPPADDVGVDASIDSGAPDTPAAPVRPVRRRPLEDGFGCAFDTVTYSAPGLDGVWHSTDDVISSWTTERLASPSRSTTTVYAAGGDGAWGSEDDRVEALLEAEFVDLSLTEVRRLRYRRTLSAPGPDGLWSTSDDLATGLEAFSYVDGRLASVATSSAPGDDGLWDTGDDEVAMRGRYAHALDAFTGVFYRSPSGGGAWTIEAGTPVYALRIVLNRDLGTIDSRLSDQPGADGVLGTSDDPTQLRDHTTCLAADELLTLRTTTGADGVVGTADDVLVGWATTAASGDCPVSACDAVTPF